MRLLEPCPLGTRLGSRRLEGPVLTTLPRYLGELGIKSGVATFLSRHPPDLVSSMPGQEPQQLRGSYSVQSRTSNSTKLVIMSLDSILTCNGASRRFDEEREKSDAELRLPLAHAHRFAIPLTYIAVSDKSPIIRTYFCDSSSQRLIEITSVFLIHGFSAARTQFMATRRST